jgi:hypothetical protein
MKQIFVITSFALALLLGTTSCDKGCTCKYYDENGNLVETENWDSDVMSETECSSRDGQTNVSITVDSESMVASRVECTSGTSSY